MSTRGNCTLDIVDLKSWMNKVKGPENIANLNTRLEWYEIETNGKATFAYYIIIFYNTPHTSVSLISN